MSGDFLIILYSSSVRDGTAVNKVTGQGMEYRALGSGNVEGFPDRLCGPATLLSNGLAGDLTPFLGKIRGSIVVKVLCYKSEGRWFDPSCCHWSFSLT